MKLTKQIAEQNIGRFIDCHKRRFGYYPMRIVKIGDNVYIQDSIGIQMPIPEDETDFNCPDYDFFIGYEVSAREAGAKVVEE